MKMAPRHRLDTRKTRGLPLTDAGKPRKATVCRSHRERKVYFQIRVLEFRREPRRVKLLDFRPLVPRRRPSSRLRSVKQRLQVVPWMRRQSGRCCASVRVECLNERAEPITITAQGWYARILRHEMNHLNGTLYIDRMQTRSFITTENVDRFWKSRTIEQVRKDLGIDS